MRTLSAGLTLAFLATPTVVQAETDPAVQRIDAYHTAILGIMKQGKSLSMSARVEKFLPVIRNYYDVASITALLVGPSWTSTPASARTAAIEAVARHSAVSHATNFKSFDGERFAAEPKSTKRGNDLVVRASITGSDTTKLAYRMRQSGGTWKILDVYSDGVSQLSVQRSDFASSIASGGAAGLAKKLAEMDAKNGK